MRVVHVITHLEAAGAQRMLAQLVQHGADDVQHHVVSLRSGGRVATILRCTGVRVTELGMKPGRLSLRRLVQLRRLLKDQADVVQTWLYHGDLLGGLAGRSAGRPVVWNIRHSELDPSTLRASTIMAARLCARLSSVIPHQIICCSAASLQSHQDLGYSAPMVVIPNGFDMTRFRPDPLARRQIRSELNVTDDATVIGLVARFHPQKDHATFLRSIAAVRGVKPRIAVVLVGENLDDPKLLGLIERLGLATVVHRLGVRKDIERVTAAFDVAVMAARSGEGFPNTIGEAMSCGVPCVVTDTGDSGQIVGETGIVVPPASEARLAAGILELIDRPDLSDLGVAARRRIAQRYEFNSIRTRYEALWRERVG